MDSIVLRFRDLITEDGGTISDHKELIRSHGEVWWGWWMKQYETPPMDLFKFIKETAVSQEYYKAYLFNSGTMELFRTNIVDIIVAPPTSRIGTPEPQRSPAYYHRGSYPAWFLLSKIHKVNIEEKNIVLKDFPTISDSSQFREQNAAYKGKVVDNLEILRKMDVTMWSVNI